MSTTTEPNKGWIYTAFDLTICGLWHLNPVKYFRDVAVYITRRQPDEFEKINGKLYAMDIYIIFKWLLIFILTLISTSNYAFTFIKWYLIAANLHSFFYYFVWKEHNSDDFTADRLRRRFIHLFQAVFFSHFAFASLYYRDYAFDLEWPKKGVNFLGSLWLSISNSVGGNYDVVKFKTDNAYSVMMIQYIITFLFVGIIVSKAIPNYKARNSPISPP